VVNVWFTRFDYRPATLDFLLGYYDKGDKGFAGSEYGPEKIMPDPGSSGF
jgi:hypothetical protein